MIRGAVAFGLVLRIDSAIPNRSVIVTSSLVLVIGTTIFMGSILFGDLTKKAGNDEHHEKSGNAEESVHEMFLHPNYDISRSASVSQEHHLEAQAPKKRF